MKQVELRMTFPLLRGKRKARRESVETVPGARGRATGFALAAAALLAAVSAHAQVGAVAGAGSRSCAQLQADIADLPNVRRAYVSWMQGYLSGRNAAREAEGLGLVDLNDYEAQWRTVTRWCAEHPSSGFAEAVDALFEGRVSLAGD